jgi:hypothetical protein
MHCLVIDWPQAFRDIWRNQVIPCFLLCCSASHPSRTERCSGRRSPSNPAKHDHRPLSLISNVDFSSSCKSPTNRGDHPLWWRDVLLDKNPPLIPPHLSEAADRRTTTAREGQGTVHMQHAKIIHDPSQAESSESTVQVALLSARSETTGDHTARCDSPIGFHRVREKEREQPRAVGQF